MKNKSQDLFWSFVTKIINYHVIFYSNQKLKAGTSLEVTPLKKRYFCVRLSVLKIHVKSGR